MRAIGLRFKLTPQKLYRLFVVTKVSENYIALGHLGFGGCAVLTILWASVVKGRLCK